MQSLAEDIAAVSRIGIVSTILDVVTQTTGMRFAAVARVTESQWIACAVKDGIDFGLKPGGELQLETTICNEIRQHHQPVVFGTASAHPTFSTHHTPKHYGLESYISVPIFRRGGQFFGTLCAIDSAPAPNLEDPRIVKTLMLFAQLIASQLDLEDRVERSTAALVDARSKLHLRDQFAAVLGHDLRGPLRTISVGSKKLREQWPGESPPPSLLATIQQACRRMGSLIDDILDFARGTLGDGIPIQSADERGLGSEITQVVDEFRLAHPKRSIDLTLSLPEVLHVDRRRIAQMLGNLLENAVAHGDRDRPIAVVAGHTHEQLLITVTNFGKPIDADIADRLFQPFVRTQDRNVTAGLGLGLYIASEIARGHNGALSQSAHDGKVSFTFSMPLSPV